MVSKQTVERIWCAYREVEAGEKLLEDMQKIRENERLDKFEPTLKDAFGRRRQLQLGIPSGENAHRLLDVSPVLAESVIRAHIEHKKAELAEANEQARIELGKNPTFVGTGYVCTGCEVPCRLDVSGKPFDLTSAYCYMDGNKTGVDWRIIRKD